jgi:hypothetical protein
MLLGIDTPAVWGSITSRPELVRLGWPSARWAPLKRLLSRAAGVSLRLLARFPTHNATNNFRLYNAGLVNQLGIESNRGFEVEGSWHFIVPTSGASDTFGLTRPFGRCLFRLCRLD